MLLACPCPVFAAQGDEVRAAFLEPAGGSPEKQQQQQTRGQQAAAAAAGPTPASPATGSSQRRLLPRPPMGSAAQLRAALQGLFPPGMAVPEPLALAAAVQAVAEQAGVAHVLPGPLALALPQGVAPPPGMLAVGLAGTAELPAVEAIFGRQPQLAGGPAAAQQAQREQREQEPAEQLQERLR